MQGYLYSVFSLAAIVIHLIINFNLLIGRKTLSMYGRRYRGFLLGILAYYITDASWGIVAGLGWTTLLYIDTIFFFLSLVAFVFMWSRFVIAYLELDKWAAKILNMFGYEILAFNLAALAVNVSNHCVFHIDAQGIYQTGFVRDLAFYLLIAYSLIIAIFVFAKALKTRDSVHRRSLMILMSCITITVALALQVIWPLTPFTALGCLISNCFLHVFVIQDERTAKHMAELEKALERAQAAEKARSMFFSIVSHDIRTPLNAILGYSELLQDGLKSQEEKDIALKSIRASGTTLLQLVNDVLDLAKMDAGKMTLKPGAMNLNQLTEDVFLSFKMAASEKGIELINKTGDIPSVWLDGHRFRQILFNLVGNAVKFTERGSVTVSASYENKRLELSVSDTGCGIPPDMLSRILDPFVQVQDPSHAADRAGGTGLGLSICKRLVEAMGGKLFVESEIGKGSTFRACIPGVEYIEKKPGTVAKPKSVVSQRRLPKHVLVIDDSPVNRKVLETFLKKIGIPAIGLACDGCEALKELDSAAGTDDPYDFILSDLWMPNMNGLEFIEKLRADPRFSSIPVFAVTADTEFKRDPRTKFFTGTLLKPVTYAKLTGVFSMMR